MTAAARVMTVLPPAPLRPGGAEGFCRGLLRRARRRLDGCADLVVDGLERARVLDVTSTPSAMKRDVMLDVAVAMTLKRARESGIGEVGHRSAQRDGDAMASYPVYRLVAAPAAARIVRGRWVLAYKYNQLGQLADPARRTRYVAMVVTSAPARTLTRRSPQRAS